MIAAKVANALALDYPRERLELIVASDGSADATVERARAAGADLVLDLPRGGKIAAQNAAAEQRLGRDPRLLRRQQRLGARTPCAAWSSPSPTRRSATPAARSASSTPRATTSRAPTGATRWRSARWSPPWPGSPPATARSTRCAATPTSRCRPSGSHDLSFPFQLAKRGLRSLYVPAARRRGEDGADAGGRVRPQAADDGRPLGHRRRRRDARARAATRRSTPSRSPPTGCCATRPRSSTCSPSSPTSPCSARAGSTRRPRRPARRSLAAALLGRRVPLAPLRIARYYVMTTASIAAGLWDRLRHGAPGAWEKARGPAEPMPRAFDVLARRRSPCSSSRRCCRSPRSRSSSAAAAR